MRYLIVDQYYPKFLRSFCKNKKIKDEYEIAKSELMAEMFGTADFYSRALSKLGHEAEEVVVNDERLQTLWMKQEGKELNLSIKDRMADYILSRSNFFNDRLMSCKEAAILYEQIKSQKPDVLYIQNIGYVNGELLNKVKPMVKLIVGQIASPIPVTANLKLYDLMITSFPHFVKEFKRRGVAAEYLKLAFEPDVLKRIGRQQRRYEVSFVGGISRAHKKGFKLLNQLADRIKIDVWGYGREELDKNSNLYKYHHGEVWGKEMYKILLQSKITINRHIDVAGNYANNTRLYEATGCGAMLITDQKKNLGDIFDVGKEVETYKNVDELVSKILDYIKQPQKRDDIAKRGQKKTLAKHNYLKRMEELNRIVEKYL